MLLLLAVATASISSEPLSAQDADSNVFNFRNLGAFRVSAWVGELAVPLDPTNVHRNTWYVAPRAGGVWKTTNNGTTFECITDDLGTTYIGDVEVATSNPDIVWVGTGDNFNARSSYYGNGIWKSNDAGKSWTNMGLKKSSHIAEIIIHPTNPDIVWVAVMGKPVFPKTRNGEFFLPKMEAKPGSRRCISMLQRESSTLPLIPADPNGPLRLELPEGRDCPGRSNRVVKRAGILPQRRRWTLHGSC